MLLPLGVQGLQGSAVALTTGLTSDGGGHPFNMEATVSMLHGFYNNVEIQAKHQMVKNSCVPP